MTCDDWEVALAVDDENKALPHGVNLFCCGLPNLTFTWHLGVEEGHPQGTVPVLQISQVQCMECGARWQFDDGDESFPLVERARAVLRVVPEKMTRN